SIGNIARNLDHRENDVGSQAWAWRRTMLRSLMIILLLDKARFSKVFPSCLFRASSPHKSSASVLQALATMLFPSLGDVTRPLGHLNYRLSHVQHSLEEYTYIVSNIATDLRD